MNAKPITIMTWINLQHQWKCCQWKDKMSLHVIYKS
jgi:hypothetical protein